VRLLCGTGQEREEVLAQRKGAVGAYRDNRVLGRYEASGGWSERQQGGEHAHGNRQQDYCGGRGWPGCPDIPKQRTIASYEELYEEIDAEGAALPPEQWRDGYWDAGECIVEACEVGIYRRFDVSAMMVTRYTNDKSVWTYEQMRDEVFPAEIEGVDMDQFIGGELTFVDWITESLNLGIYRKVDVAEYRDEDDDEIIAERLVIDE
jgi:hypothetical protein